MDSGVEGFQGLNDVVGWHHEHDAVRITFEYFEGGESDAGSCVSGGRFDEQIVFREFGELLLGGGSLQRVGDDPGIRGFGPGAAAVERLLDHGAIAGEPQELFGELSAALRPESGAASTGHNHCMQHVEGSWRGQRFSSYSLILR
jgi:hypothetical protein